MAVTINGTTGVSAVQAGAVEQGDLAANVAGNGPAFSAYSLTPQVLSPSTTTKITLDVEEYDTASCFSSSRFTPNVAGYYQLNTQIRWDTTNNFNSLNVSIWKNGSEWIRLGEIYGGGAAYKMTQMLGSVLIYLNGSTDYVEFYAVASTTGANQTTGYNDFRYANHFQGFLARAA